MCVLILSGLNVLLLDVLIVTEGHMLQNTVYRLPIDQHWDSLRAGPFARKLGKIGEKIGGRGGAGRGEKKGKCLFECDLG